MFSTSPSQVDAAASRWFLDLVEVVNEATGKAAYFTCRKWLERSNSFEITLLASARDPTKEEIDYKVRQGDGLRVFATPAITEMLDLMQVLLVRSMFVQASHGPPLHKCQVLHALPVNLGLKAVACNIAPCACMQICIVTSAFCGAETSGNVIVDITGVKGRSGVLTLRNKGGASFRAGQVSSGVKQQSASCRPACRGVLARGGGVWVMLGSDGVGWPVCMFRSAHTSLGPHSNMALLLGPAAAGHLPPASAKPGDSDRAERGARRPS